MGTLLAQGMKQCSDSGSGVRQERCSQRSPGEGRGFGGTGPAPPTNFRQPGEEAAETREGTAGSDFPEVGSGTEAGWTHTPMSQL